MGMLAAAPAQESAAAPGSPGTPYQCLRVLRVHVSCGELWDADCLGTVRGPQVRAGRALPGRQGPVRKYCFSSEGGGPSSVPRPPQCHSRSSSGVGGRRGKGHELPGMGLRWGGRATCLPWGQGPAHPGGLVLVGHWSASTDLGWGGGGKG